MCGVMRVYAGEPPHSAWSRSHRRQRPIFALSLNRFRQRQFGSGQQSLVDLIADEREAQQ